MTCGKAVESMWTNPSQFFSISTLWITLLSLRIILNLIHTVFNPDFSLFYRNS